ncbi:uncharacterized protein DC041_0009297 [Schistosoma bovis]|uniref:GTP-eEF1A C-terminal domain-containing protein n=1 Tax=Schistosoma bovis TaxID=6184 RepID=A0A430QSR1_SCHBO|nr:uncharacterized protein DC041_0009297 [Schistosoma bovis]
MKEVSIRKIICLLDKKTNEKTKIYPRFIKAGDAAIVRFEVSNNTHIYEDKILFSLIVFCTFDI